MMSKGPLSERYESSGRELVMTMSSGEPRGVSPRVAKTRGLTPRGSPGSSSLSAADGEQVLDQVGHLLPRQLRLEVVRHQRLPGRLDLVDLTAQQHVFRPLAALQRDARRRLRRQ